MHFPTQHDLLALKKKAENKLIVYEDQHTPFEYDQFTYEGHEVVEIMKDKKRY